MNNDSDIRLGCDDRRGKLKCEIDSIRKKIRLSKRLPRKDQRNVRACECVIWTAV